MELQKNDRRYLPLVLGGSLIIPAVVAILYFAPKWKTGIDFGFLPPLYATINGITALVLIMGWRAIMKRNIERHRKLMSTAIVLSVLFLLFYILYHLTSDTTPYGGEGVLKYIYYFILLTHIFLSVVIVPMVLITYTRALAERFDKHRKIAKWTLPLWLYVAITGVLVYLLIAPYYS